MLICQIIIISFEDILPRCYVIMEPHYNSKHVLFLHFMIPKLPCSLINKSHEITLSTVSVITSLFISKLGPKIDKNVFISWRDNSRKMLICQIIIISFEDILPRCYVIMEPHYNSKHVLFLLFMIPNCLAVS